MYKAPLILVFVFGLWNCYAQKNTKYNFTLDAQYTYGVLLRHNKNVAHLVRNQPTGFLLSYNQKTYGKKYWQESYNYPDWGISFWYQDFGNEVLGQNYSLLAHYNFYFFKRNLLFRVGQGISYNTNPFDIDTNFKNVAYGSNFLTVTSFLLQYQINLYEGFSIQVGPSFIHHSNGGRKAPNVGTNVASFNVGVNYSIENDKEAQYVVSTTNSKDFVEPLKFNFVFRSGANEGDFFNLGQHPFYVFSAYADKRLNYQSTIQLGVDYFISEFLKREIEYVSVSFPSRNVDPETDYKRAGVFVGHELRIGKIAIPTQVGYYIYWPYEYESRVYSRIGAKYYFHPKIFAVASLKSHSANAENIEFGLGVRL